jgi:L-ribulose-5-phosphate 4-epimerase
MQGHEIESQYEWNTGQAIVRCFSDRDPLRMRAVLVCGHGPFCWGASASDAAHTAVILEEVARMAFAAVLINPAVEPICDALRDRHFLRKHGPNATYGQG